MPKKKATHGGARTGSGPKTKKPPTTTLSIRHDAEVIKKIRKSLDRGQIAKLGREWLDKLSKEI